MADTLKRLSGPTLLTASAATQYTVPSATTTTLRNVHVVNETGTAATFTLSIGTDGAGKRLWWQTSIPANGFLDWSGVVVLAAAEVLQALSGTASALTLTISGVETDATTATGLTLTPATAPAAPASGATFYVDSADSKLKAIKANGDIIVLG